MLTKEMNDRLTQVGPGTPGGELLRRYWHPVATVAELEKRSTLKVRLLAEDLVLFRDNSGTLGLLAELCPHRRCSLVFGVVESTGVRCPYHGWLFDNEGNCLEQPSESVHSVFKDRIKTPAYEVREMGGFFWAFMGPGEPPLLPKHDYFVKPNTLREIGKTLLPINWLQAMENSLDPIHSEWLHSWYTHYKRHGVKRLNGEPFPQARHAKIGFDIFEYGIIKRRYYEGGSEEDSDWKIGHPILFPNILKQGSTFQIRVPLDDENTLHYLYTTTSYPGVEAPIQDVVPVYDFPYLGENGEIATEWTTQQDMMAWVTQGRIADRTVEHLGSSDRGVILLRKVLDEMISLVAEGEDPLGVFRDAAHDGQIDVPVEAMLPPLTPTSARSAGREPARWVNGDDQRFYSAADKKNTNEVALDPEIVEKQMRSGGGQELSPILEEKIKMHIEYLKLQRADT
jgi:5,5'-dehydrodivanillate O-demethylase